MIHAHVAALVVGAAPPAPRLFTDSAPADDGISAVVWLGALAGVLVLLTAATISRLAWRGWLIPPASDRAFGAMARSLRLPRASQRIIRQMAGAIGAAPIALLVAESAFVRARDAWLAAPEAGGAADPRTRSQLEALRATLFNTPQ